MKNITRILALAVALVVAALFTPSAHAARQVSRPAAVSHVNQPIVPPFTANAVTVELQAQTVPAELDEHLFGTQSANEYFAGVIQALEISYYIVGEYGVNSDSLQYIDEAQLYYDQINGGGATVVSNPSPFWQGVNAGFTEAIDDLLSHGVYGAE